MRMDSFRSQNGKTEDFTIRGLDGGQCSVLLISERQKAVIDPTMSPFQGLDDQAKARSIVPRTARLAQYSRVQNCLLFIYI